MTLAADIEVRLGRIFTLVARIEDDREDEMERAGEFPGGGTTETLVRSTPQNQNQTECRVSSILTQRLTPFGLIFHWRNTCAQQADFPIAKPRHAT